MEQSYKGKIKVIYHKNDINFIDFGDSISASYYATDLYGYPKMLKDAFNASFVDYAVSGYASFNYRDDFEEKLVNGIDKNKRNICLIALGVNDSLLFEGRDYNPIEDYETDMENYIHICKSHNVEVILIGLTRCDETRTTPINWTIADERYLNSRIEKYDSKLKEIAKRNSCLYIDLSKTITLERNHDGVHPNDDGHKAMFDKVSKEIYDYITK